MFGSDRLARLLGVLGDLSAELKTSTNPRLSFEIALTRMVRPDSDLTLEALAERIEALESGYSACSRVIAPAAAPAAAPAPAGAGAQVKAPMPGTILDVKVQAGQSVKKGDVLVILEAMKMENEICAPSDGKITGVNVRKGDSVETQALLCTIA